MQYCGCRLALPFYFGAAGGGSRKQEVGPLPTAWQQWETVNQQLPALPQRQAWLRMNSSAQLL